MAENSTVDRNRRNRATEPRKSRKANRRKSNRKHRRHRPRNRRRGNLTAKVPSTTNRRTVINASAARTIKMPIATVGSIPAADRSVRIAADGRRVATSSRAVSRDIVARAVGHMNGARRPIATSNATSNSSRLSDSPASSRGRCNSANARPTKLGMLLATATIAVAAHTVHIGRHRLDIVGRRVRIIGTDNRRDSLRIIGSGRGVDKTATATIIIIITMATTAVATAITMATTGRLITGSRLIGRIARAAGNARAALAGPRTGDLGAEVATIRNGNRAAITADIRRTRTRRRGARSRAGRRRVSRVSGRHRCVETTPRRRRRQ